MAKRRAPRPPRDVPAAPPPHASALQLALAKRASGQPLNRGDERTIAKAERQARERLLDEALRTLPKGKYCELANRQHKVIDDAARRLGLPLTGRTIDLYAAIAALHDVLAANRHRIRPTAQAASDDDESNLELAKLAGEVEQLKNRNALLRRQLGRDRELYLPRAELRRRLDWLRDELKRFGEQLGRQFGAEPQTALNDLLLRLAREASDGMLDVDKGTE
jgi:hypothetical protein